MGLDFQDVIDLWHNRNMVRYCGSRYDGNLMDIWMYIVEGDLTDCCFLQKENMVLEQWLSCIYRG